MISITPGQALLLILHHAALEESEKKSLMALYLNGAHDASAKTEIESWLEHPLLEDYHISEDPYLIAYDPTRRFFESELARLCFEDDAHTLPAPEIFKLICDLIDLQVDHEIQTKNKPGDTPKEKTHSMTYDVSHALSTRFNDSSVSKPYRKTNEHILKIPCTYIHLKYPLYLVNMLATRLHISAKYHKNLPFPIYDVEPIFTARHRGRLVASNIGSDYYTYGSMTGSTPKPHHFGLKAHAELKYKSTTQCLFLSESKFGKQLTQLQTQSFVGGISGYMLCYLRALKLIHLKRDHSLLNNKHHFVQICRMLMCYNHLLTGGHSLYEFIAVFQLEPVKLAFKSILGEPPINVGTFFNTETIQHILPVAIKHSAQYTFHMVSRQKVHNELRRYAFSMLPTQSNLRIHQLWIKKIKKTTQIHFLQSWLSHIQKTIADRTSQPQNKRILNLMYSIGIQKLSYHSCDETDLWKMRSKARESQFSALEDPPIIFYNVLIDWLKKQIQNLAKLYKMLSDIETNPESHPLSIALGSQYIRSSDGTLELNLKALNDSLPTHPLGHDIDDPSLYLEGDSDGVSTSTQPWSD